MGNSIEEYLEEGNNCMQLKKDEIIRNGEKMFSVFCVVGSVIYVKPVSDVKDSPVYELKEVLEYYRKIEILKK